MTIPRPRSRPRPNWSWQDDGLCHGEDLVLFFGPDGERQPERDVRERKAKAICAQCPVKEFCLDYALARPEKFGTWGGLNEEERASERRRLMRNGRLPELPQPAAKEIPGKRCSTCKDVQPTKEFYRDGRAADGLTWVCRSCIGASKLRRRLDMQAAAGQATDEPAAPQMSAVPSVTVPREKQCGTCGVIQPASAYARHGRTADGLVAKCDDCTHVERRQPAEVA